MEDSKITYEDAMKVANFLKSNFTSLETKIKDLEERVSQLENP